MLVADAVHQRRRLERQQTGGVDLDARLGDPFAPDALLGNLFAEGDPAVKSFAHQLQRALGDADGAHAVVDAARPEPALGDFEAAPFAQQQIRRRHPHVVEQNFAMAVRGVVVAEHRQRAHHGDAGRICRHQDHRLLGMAGRQWIGFSHHDVDLAARVAGAGDPPFVAVDHILVAVTLDAGGDVGRIRRGDVRLGHCKRRADFAAQQRLQPCALVLFGAIALDGFHVARIGRGAVEHFRRPHHAAHDFAQRRVVEVRQAIRGARRFGQEQIPQSLLACQRFEPFDQFGRNPALALFEAVAVDFLLERFFVRIDMLVHEGEQTRLQLLAALGVIEIHRQSFGLSREKIRRWRPARISSRVRLLGAPSGHSVVPARSTRCRRRSAS